MQFALQQPSSDFTKLLKSSMLPAHDFDMENGPVQVAPWKRHGKHRLYVTCGDETKVGFWDLLTDEGHPETPDQLSLLTAAVQGWKTTQTCDVTALVTVPPVSELSATVPVPTVPPSIDARPWLDLTTNAAGASAREQATTARDDAPVRTMLARALGVRNEERAWRIGADGEAKVAAQLAKAAKKDPRWQFIHAIPVGQRGSDIDHLIVGPGGVFTVNTKHHPKAKIWVGGSTFLVDGHKQPYLRNSQHEATRAARLLTDACGFPVHVEALIVTVNAADVTVKNTPTGVHVLPRMQIADWLLRHGDIHDDETISAVYEGARRSTTWQP